MKLLRNYKDMEKKSLVKLLEVPTGKIAIMKGEHGLLEFLSIGDYGQAQNIKADFLGITREINGVPNGSIMPLEDKWVVTISTQYGCSMNCKFCDVPKVGKGRNATLQDMIDEVEGAIQLNEDVKHTNRLNVHYARMGEPTWNNNVLIHAEQLPEIIKPYLGDSLIHPVVSTMLPKNNRNLEKYLLEWCRIKNITYKGEAGLQFSINSTDNDQRNYMFSGNALTIEEVGAIGDKLPMPVGRKYALNFALADDYIVNEVKLRELFDPKKFMCKITPLHKTNSCEDNNIQTTGGYESYTPYQGVERRLKNVGFDVLVFVPSLDEDESRITCGNAILKNFNK